VYVDDVVSAFLSVIERSASPVYNIGTGRETRIRDLIETLEAISGRPFAVNARPDWPNDIRRISADCRLAADELGFGAAVSLDEGLRRTVACFQQPE
jgi:nucleoside-diphosphate-sugar epimerase